MWTGEQMIPGELDRETDQNHLLDQPLRVFPPDYRQEAAPDRRVQRIKRRLLRTDRQIDLERARLATEAYRRTEGQPMPIRRASMLLHIAREMSITIAPDELLVG